MKSSTLILLGITTLLASMYLLLDHDDFIKALLIIGMIVGGFAIYIGLIIYYFEH